MSNHTEAPSSAKGRIHHHIVIVGGGSGGISVAARLRRAGVRDIAIVEPSATHFYQPLWTLVGGGAAPREASARPMKSVVPRGVEWIQDRVASFDPENNSVETESSGTLSYDFLVASPGLQLDWDKIPGLLEALDTPFVSSNYHYDRAPKTWEMLQNFSGGNAIFTCAPMPIKCAGAPQKIMYLASDYFRRKGILASSNVTYATATPAMFGVKEYSAILDGVVERYGIETRFQHTLRSIDPGRKEATFEVKVCDETKEVQLDYDIMHVTPPQSAPDFIKRSPLAASAGGWIDVDKHTLQHVKYDNVFALGDATNTPNAKTGAAIRKQAPALTENLLARIAGQELPSSYGGYGSCPLVTSYRTMLLCEFDYTGKPTPTVPLLDMMKERTDMGTFKRYGLPILYWYGMLRGRA